MDKARFEGHTLTESGWAALGMLGPVPPIREDPGGTWRKAYMDTVAKHRVADPVTLGSPPAPAPPAKVAGFTSIGAVGAELVKGPKFAPPRETSRRKAPGRGANQTRDVTCTACGTRERVPVSRTNRLRNQSCTCGGRWRETNRGGTVAVDKRQLAADLATIAKVLLGDDETDELERIVRRYAHTRSDGNAETSE